MQLAFGCLRHGDEERLAPASANTLFIGLCFRTVTPVTPVGPSSLRELARLTVLCRTRSIPKHDPARIDVTLDRNRNPDGNKLEK
jgi:hypothetical protein